MIDRTKSLPRTIMPLLLAESATSLAQDLHKPSTTQKNVAWCGAAWGRGPTYAVTFALLLQTSACAIRVPGSREPTPKWPTVSGPCLALSGGGLRSGAVSLGALQGLHASGYLSRVAIISTVSGGGYPVYGLAYRLIEGEDSLENLLTEDGRHIRSADNNAEFIGGLVSQLVSVPLAVFLWSPLSWFAPYSAAQPTYGAEIHHTFARGLIGILGRPKLRDAHVLPSRGFPTVVFGASAKRGIGAPKRGDTLFVAGDYFELAADLSGSPTYGYYKELANVLELNKVVAISGAALDAPNGGLPDFLKTIKLGLGSTVKLSEQGGQDPYVFLSDAGFVESLGILPLLRRGCREILAFDNTHDPNAEFNSWSTFVTVARAEGWTLVDSLSPESSAAFDRTGNAWHLSEHYWAATLRKGDTTTRVRLVKLGIDSSNLDQYPLAIQTFVASSGDGPLDCNGKTGFGQRCSFPMESTARQSYSHDEFRAYRHLGRCLAKRAVQTECDK